MTDTEEENDHSTINQSNEISFKAGIVFPNTDSRKSILEKLKNCKYDTKRLFFEGKVLHMERLE